MHDGVQTSRRSSTAEESESTFFMNFYSPQSNLGAFAVAYLGGLGRCVCRGLLRWAGWVGGGGAAVVSFSRCESRVPNRGPRPGRCALPAARCLHLRRARSSLPSYFIWGGDQGKPSGGGRCLSLLRGAVLATTSALCCQSRTAAEISSR
jgi:hypothetical protein